jgi:hypothetical protein
MNLVKYITRLLIVPSILHFVFIVVSILNNLKPVILYLGIPDTELLNFIKRGQPDSLDTAYFCLEGAIDSVLFLLGIAVLQALAGKTLHGLTILMGMMTWVTILVTLIVLSIKGIMIYLSMQRIQAAILDAVWHGHVKPEMIRKIKEISFSYAIVHESVASTILLVLAIAYVVSIATLRKIVKQEMKD